MDTFSLIRNSLAESLADASKAGLARDEIEIGRITAAVQVVVDVLTPPDGGRYIVGFVDISTAATALGERRIAVSSKPLHDKSLTTVEKAVVIATFAAHEIGHTLVTRPRKDLIAAHNAKTGYHAVANLADDIILEPYMVDRFPILADAFEFTGMWVLRTTAESLPKVMAITSKSSTADRYNALLNATRYGDIAEIVWANNAACDDRDWGRAWADRLISARLTDHATFLALCDEAWQRVRTEVEPDEDEPEPEPEPDEDEQDGDGDEDESEPEGDEPDEDDGDEPGEDGDGEDDESEDDESEDEPTDGGDDESDDGEDADDDEQDGDDDSDGGDDATDEDGDEDDPDGGDGEDADDDEQDPDEGDEPGGDDEGGDDEGGDEPTGEGGRERDPDGGVKTGKPGDDIGEQDNDPDWDDDDDESEPTGEGEGDPDDGHADQPTDEQGENGGGNAEATVRDEDSFDQSEVDESTHDSSQHDPRDYAAREDDAKVRTYTSTTVTAFGRHGSITTTWE